MLSTQKGKKKWRCDAVHKGDASKPQFRDARKISPMSRTCVRRRRCGSPAIWLVHLSKKLKQRSLDLLNIPVHSSQRSAHAGFPMIGGRESISHMPGLIRTKSNCAPRAGGRGKERECCQGLWGSGLPQHRGLNFPRLSSANPKSKPTLPYEHKRREFTLPSRWALLLKVQKTPLEAGHYHKGPT